MKNTISIIKNYILYLKKECNLSITLHNFQEKFFLESELLTFNIHENPYCIYIKSSAEAHEHCIKKQKSIIEKCESGSFVGICHAGVKEFIYPVSYNDSVLGFISVSGYSCENSEEYLTAVAKKYPLSFDKLYDTYSVLSKNMPSKTYVDTLILPLCQMLEFLHVKHENSNTVDEGFIHKVIHYIKLNYTKDLTSDILCNHFQCSRSHLSHLFNKDIKTSLRTYINSLRIESAKTLLRDTQLEIAEISSSVGFFDPNYFTSIFKKHCGITPSVYRQTQQKR